MSQRTGERTGGLDRTDVPGTSVFVETNGVRLHTVRAGPEDGPLVVLLHGFPEFWYCWHDQIRPLANAGYRVVVPDQRGYNVSDKPVGTSAYRLDELAADVVGIVDDAGRETAHVVGHDWGAAVAWWLALHHTERVESLTAINVPHPSAMRRALRSRWGQRLRSWYFLAFQLPVLPETVSRLGGYRLMERTMTETSLPGTFTEADFDRYRDAWSQPGALTAMVNWYRAVVRERSRPRTERVTVPTLVLWGTEDRFLETRLAHESVDYCDDGRVSLVHGATHWLPHEEPVRVAEALREQFE
jgi:pimeloyl-ACP methyl ester carboxylesterase